MNIAPAKQLFVVSLLVVLGGCATSRAVPTQQEDIGRILDLPVTRSEGVAKVTKPRTDLQMTMDGFPITPRMGLTAWASFAPHDHSTMLMGDIPVMEDELQSVLSMLMEYGLEVSALHNHFFGEQPRVLFLHVGGMGDAARLARGLRAAFDAIDRIRVASPISSGSPLVPHASLNVEQVSNIIDAAGELKDGVLKITIPRPSIRLTEMGREVNAMMGFNSWMAFQGTDKRAAVSGDFAMLAEEVNLVVHELRRANITVVAIHNHMLREQPRIFFLHFWGVGPAEDLAKGLRAALDAMAGSTHRQGAS